MTLLLNQLTFKNSQGLNHKIKFLLLKTFNGLAKSQITILFPIQLRIS
jgi:hypothetical protein